MAFVLRWGALLGVGMGPEAADSKFAVPVAGSDTVVAVHNRVLVLNCGKPALADSSVGQNEHV